MADELERAETAASTDIIADAAPAEGGKEQLAETLARPVPAPETDADPSPATAKQGFFARAVAYVRTHAIAVALVAVIAAVAVGLLAVAGIRQSQLPADDVVIADVRSRVETPAYSGGVFGLDDNLVLVDVAVGSKHLSTDAPEGTVLEDSFGATGYADVDVTCTFRNASVTVAHGDELVPVGATPAASFQVPLLSSAMGASLRTTFDNTLAWASVDRVNAACPHPQATCLSIAKGWAPRNPAP